MTKATLLLAAAALTLPAHGDVLRFDFGSKDLQTTDVGWNNVTYDDNNPVADLTTIINSTGATVAGVGLSVTDQFFIATQPVALGTGAPAGDAADLPVSASKDFFLGHTGEFLENESTPSGAFKLTGLDPSQTYNFTFFSSRDDVSDNRETSFTVTGSNTANGLLQSSNNDANTLVLSGITADINNEIVISLEAGPNNNNSRGFYYINSLQVEIVPEPGSLALLTLGGILLTRRSRRR